MNPRRPARDPDRQFGFVMAGMLLAITGARWALGHPPSSWLWLPALLFAALAWLTPRWLRPVRTAWLAFGHALGWLNSRLLLTVVFAGLVTPIAVLLRLAGRRPMAVGRDVKLSSYWRVRDPADFTASRMERQF